MSAPAKNRPPRGEGQPAAGGLRQVARSAHRRVCSDELLPAGQPLHIEHGGDLYILRRTGTGKLILTK